MCRTGLKKKEGVAANVLNARFVRNGVRCACGGGKRRGGGLFFICFYQFHSINRGINQVNKTTFAKRLPGTR